MPKASFLPTLIGGRLSLDFVNVLAFPGACSWEALLEFLLASQIISPERSAQLLTFPRSDPQAADALLRKANRLCTSLREIFQGMLRRETVPRERIEPINEVLRITEGHDELVHDQGKWQLEFIAREDGLEWLLAAIARSGAEIIAEGPNARLRLCANTNCGLFFYDTSRTRRRRWCSMSRCGNRHKVAAFARRHSLRRLAQ